MGQGLVMSQMGGVRGFSDSAVVSQQDEHDNQLDSADENTRLGVDTEFSRQKHAYVLTFPWNFDEIIDDFQAKHVDEKSEYYFGKYI